MPSALNARASNWPRAAPAASPSADASASALLRLAASSVATCGVTPVGDVCPVTVLPATTAPLGVFNVPSTSLLVRYRYVPLTDTNGNLAVLSLSGTNTLRLTMGGPQTNVTQKTMTLNYIAFLPAKATVPQPSLTQAVVMNGPNFVFSVATANAITYTVQYKDSLTQSNWVDSTTIVGNGATKSVTNAVVGTSRFFRISAH